MRDEYLKIPDDVDLEELEKFGFGVVYEGKTRDINAMKLTYYERLGAKTYTYPNSYRTIYHTVRVYVNNRKVRFFNLSGEVFDKHWADDLIQAGLVEKVSKKNLL